MSMVLVACGDNTANKPPEVTLGSITLMPAAPSLAAGTTATLTATGMYSDGTTRDLTAMVTWTSSAPAVATVDTHGTIAGVAKGTATITAAIAGVTGTVTVTITDATLVSIAVTPTNPSIAKGTTVQLAATGTFTDNSTQDLTTQVTWSSAVTATATVTAGGLATGVAKGNVELTAALGTVSGTTSLTVTDAVLVSLAVTPATPSIALGTTLPFTATGTFSDTTHQDLTSMVTWTAGTTATATIDATGLATSHAKGTTTIIATSGTITGQTTLTVSDAVLVSIAIDPVTPSVPHGVAQQFTATGTYSDTTTQPITAAVTWMSSNTAVAQISNVAGSNGKATTLAEGDTTISATLGTVTQSTTLHVSAAVLKAIDVTPATPSVPLGLSPQFVATGTYTDNTTQPITTAVTWTSSDETIAKVSNAGGSNGKATTLAQGTTTITATQGTITGSTVLTVTPVALQSIQLAPINPSLPKGSTVRFTATGTYSDNTTATISDTVTWGSSDLAVATISNAALDYGTAKGVKVGPTTISATLAGVTGTTTLTVTAAELKALQITPVNPSAAAGFAIDFTATGTYTDDTTANLTASVTWTSSDETIAKVSNAPGHHGEASTLAAGTTTIGATLGAIAAPTQTLTVTSATLQSITLEPLAASLPKGIQQQYKAFGTFSDGTVALITAQVTWASTDSTILAISNAPGSEGLATANALGPVTVSATLGAVSASTTATVTAAAVKTIDVAPADATIAAGLVQPYTALATYTDGTSGVDITTQVTWSSSKPTVAQILNTAGSEGKLTALAIGTTTIGATLGTVTGSTSLTVTAAKLLSIDVTPKAPAIAKGRTQQFTAMGTYTDSSIVDITKQVTWSSDLTTIAQISNASGSEGLATAVAVGGPATITATQGAISATTTMTVTAAVLDSIALAPSSVSAPPGTVVKVTATGTFSDGTTQDLTTTATWSTVDTTVATVQNGVTNGGKVTGVAVGTTTVKALSTGVTGTATVNVPTVAVTALAPADGVKAVKLASPIVVQFNQAVTTSTVTAQVAAGACTGTVQVSSDDFATCIAMTAATATYNTANSIAMFQPAAALSVLATYKTRVLTTQIQNAATVLGAVDTTQSSGWETVTDGSCPNGLRISQIYGAGGNTGASFNQDYVELHNSGVTPVSLNGMSLQYASSGGTSWASLALPNVSVPAGGYYLVGLASGGSVGAAIGADFSATAPDMSGSSGKIALVSGTPSMLAGATCAQWVAEAIDFVGYGTSATCFEGSTKMTSNLSASGAAFRGGAGCTDANAVSTDFTVATASPRNSATGALTCSCTANETDKVAEIDYCVLQFPTTTTVATGATSEAIYTRVYEAGLTEAAGANAAITAQVGYGPTTSDPASATSTYVWSAAPFNVQVMGTNNDEYAGTLVAPMTAGTYGYTGRVSRDGTNWTYCDLDGAGSNTGLTFDKTMLGAMTVTP